DYIPDYKSEYQNFFNTEQTPNVAIANYSHFKDEAKQQLRLLDLNEEDRLTAEYIIDILNNQGIMDRPVEEVMDDMSFYFQAMIELDRVQKAIKLVQTLEPVGIGACSMQECLLIQLRAMNQKRPDVK